MRSSAGRRIAGRFVLEEVLGRGGMGAVWLARDTVLDRPVAVKEMTLPVADEAQLTGLREKVLREARLAARLSHPSAVTVFDAVQSDGHVFIVMELVRARTLHDLVSEQGPLPVARGAALGLAVLDVLAEAHDLGIVHRDVKPGNVMVSDRGTVKLADFGIARLDGDDATVTATGMLVGSPAYMAPEHIRTRAEPASDLWALAATLYFAVEGISPFERETAVAALAAVMVDEPPPPRRAGAALGGLLLRMLAKQPADRPGVAEIRRELSLLAGVPTPVAARTAAEHHPEQPTAVVERRPPWPTAKAERRPPWPTPRAGKPFRQETHAEVEPPGGRDSTLVTAGVLCAAGAVLYILEVLDNWVEPRAVRAVDVPWLLLLLTLFGAGIALTGTGKRFRAAAYLVGTAALVVPVAWSLLHDRYRFDSTDAQPAIASVLLVLGVLLAATRLVKSTSTWWCRRPVHWLFALTASACGVPWLVVALQGWSSDDVRTTLSVIGVLVLPLVAGLLGPHRLGAWVLGGWAVAGTAAIVQFALLLQHVDEAGPEDLVGVGTGWTSPQALGALVVFVLALLVPTAQAYRMRARCAPAPTPS